MNSNSVTSSIYTLKKNKKKKKIHDKKIDNFFVGYQLG